ncbi:solute carrier family 22 member 7 [Aplysia californica]|uniref:Solute carrier family 22 member 7 n=1 Tax=Aplysia californica TaxID=6500 RepID=A0ABM0KAV8_APLCA|nr:solute carrier family 22 member 7 [Aplysia californica]
MSEASYLCVGSVRTAGIHPKLSVSGCHNRASSTTMPGVMACRRNPHNASDTLILSTGSHGTLTTPSYVTADVTHTYSPWRNGSTDDNNNNSSNITTTTNNSFIITGSCDLLPRCESTAYLPAASTIVSTFDLKCERSSLISHITSIQMMGVALGSYLSGEVGDRWGRKAVMYLNLSLSALANGLAAFAPSWKIYAALRFLIGVSGGGCVALSLYYPLEFVTARWRVAVAGIPSWDLGLVIYGLLMLAFKDWVLIHVSTAVLSVLLLVVVFWMPESMRWLVVNYRRDKAEAVARRMCRYNNRHLPNAQPGQIFPTKVLADQEETEQQTRPPSVLQLFSRPLVLITTLSFFIYFSMSVMYMAIAFSISALFGNFYLNFIIFALLSIPASVLVPLLGQKMGRKKGVIFLLAVSAVVGLAIVAIFFAGSGSGQKTSMTILALCISALVDQAWTLETAHSVELYPTAVRALGLGFVSLGARLGGIAAPYVVPREPDSLYVSYLIMAGLAVSSCCMLLALPETRDRALPDDILQVEPPVDGHVIDDVTGVIGVGGTDGVGEGERGEKKGGEKGEKREKGENCGEKYRETVGESEIGTLLGSEVSVRATVDNSRLSLRDVV